LIGYESPDGSAGRNRILLVEPDAVHREVLCRLFEEAGLVVGVAADGETAVLSMVRRPPRAVVLSEDLPDGSSITLVRWLRDHAGDGLPVLLLSTTGSVETAVRAYDAGADMVVSKPVDLTLLGRKLAALLRRATPPSDATETSRLVEHSA
jgi:DNA-binding response OmpR family regulator